MQYESSGTKQILLVLRDLVYVIENGGIAVVDELDSNLHPFVVEDLVHLFMSAAYNPKRAQIFYSSHNHSLLAQIDKYQIVIVEKNDVGSTETWRLDEISGVKSSDNYYARYMAGAYGGTPRLS